MMKESSINVINRYFPKRSDIPTHFIEKYLNLVVGSRQDIGNKVMLMLFSLEI